MCSSPHLWFLHAKQCILDQNFKSLWVPALICGFCMPNSEFWHRITSLYGSHTSPSLVCNQNGVICTRISSLYWFQPSSVILCLQNSDFMNRHTNLYGSQISSVVLSTHNRVLSTRIKRLYWSQPSSEVFAWKPAAFGPKLHVSMGPRTHPWFSACKTACLASELLVSIDPSPHLWFLHSKQRILYPNNKSLWVPDITCRFVHAIQRD